MPRRKHQLQIYSMWGPNMIKQERGARTGAVLTAKGMSSGWTAILRWPWAEMGELRSIGWFVQNAVYTAIYSR